MIDHFRRRFLASLPAAFAGLFGLGRATARADEADLDAIEKYAGALMPTASGNGVAPPDGHEYRVVLRNTIEREAISAVTGDPVHYAYGAQTTGWTPGYDTALATYREFLYLGGDVELQRRLIGSIEVVKADIGPKPASRS